MHHSIMIVQEHMPSLCKSCLECLSKCEAPEYIHNSLMEGFQLSFILSFINFVETSLSLGISNDLPWYGYGCFLEPPTWQQTMAQWVNVKYHIIAIFYCLFEIWFQVVQLASFLRRSFRLTITDHFLKFVVVPEVIKSSLLISP